MGKGIALALALSASAVSLSACTGQSVQIPEGTPPPPGLALPAINVDAPGRAANQLAHWAAQLSDGTRTSVVALEAYGYAAAVMAQRRPDCGVDWTTVAGVGYVETKNGTHEGSSVGEDGSVRPAIRGVALNGDGVAVIADTDGGRLDGDPVHDRAMGPMQFIPETWQRFGSDANGDSVVDPDNIDDAALTTAFYLCARAGELRSAQGWTAAILAYNQAQWYVDRVRNAAAAYSVGARPRR